MAAQFGRRLRKGAVTTAVAAVAVAALSASQAPGATVDDNGRATAADAQPSPDATAGDGSATGNSPYYTDLPPLNSPSPVADRRHLRHPAAEAEAGIPATVLDAYKKAAAELQESKPGCNLPWQLLAAIGQVESGQARGGRVDADGTTISKILGPQLDGNGFALIKDTDNGAYDGNSSYDRPSAPCSSSPPPGRGPAATATATARRTPTTSTTPPSPPATTCAATAGTCRSQGDLDRAILSYNPSQDYLNTVLSWLEYYRKGTYEVPDGTGTAPGQPQRRRQRQRPSPHLPGRRRPRRPARPRRTTPGTGSPSADAAAADHPAAPGTPTPPAPTTPHPHRQRWTTWRTRAPRSSPRWRATRSPRRSAPGRERGRQGRRQGPGPLHDRRRHRRHLHRRRERRHRSLTNSSGVAIAPALQAGEKTGDLHRPRDRRRPCRHRPRLHGHRHRARRRHPRPHQRRPR